MSTSKLSSDTPAQQGIHPTTKVVIITSTDEDNKEILSLLTPSHHRTFVVDINDTNLINVCEQIKRSLSNSESGRSTDASKNPTAKKRKNDLTCVVCGGQANGYNFGQISCESCKAFFRRNAPHSIENTKCIAHPQNFTEVRCDIRPDIKHKCQRCRLIKCFQTGMLKDHISTREEKQLKQKRLEENRRLRFELPSDDNPVKSENVFQPILTTPSLSNSFSSLTATDWSCLMHVQNAYSSASQSTPLASSMVTLELAPDKMSAFMNSIDIQNFTAVKLISFLRAIPEFEQLDERDRLTLVKYNLTLLFLMRHSLTFDTIREICYDLDTSGSVSPTDEAFAQYCKSLFILCYGYEFNQTIVSILRTLVSIINKDLLTTQLLMIIIIFSKGLSSNDEQEPILIDERRVFDAQSKYIDLLFRYFMERSSFEQVTIKMTRITALLLKIQKDCRDFQQYIRNEVDLTHINPLMRSLLHLT